MKQIPKLLNTEMVRAVLAGTKTQTRMPCSGQPMFATQGYVDNLYLDKCPFGAPGDIMWVRENWKPGAWDISSGGIAIDYEASPELVNTPWCYFDNDLDGEIFDEFILKVTDELIDKKIECDRYGFYNWEPGKSPLSWRPSIHMRREFSRINLLNKDVRVERVQDISEGDIAAEGVRYHKLYEEWGGVIKHPKAKDDENWYRWYQFASTAFSCLWNSIYAKPKPRSKKGAITHYESYPWSEETRDQRTEINGVPHICWPNPMVWACDFERME
jgi:hypothetical protein